ncbi:hypothetical protein MVLG_02797 [Microbotryum lychnidis-dioicae p1A1 Lamole]|uniref:G-patch domain-containing protein n=1 Tax=Microbotryum lychnidis-dioicae (strain p1A1 Lamole / MvSl-1064) TaxID=683840 RepID=U5H693_USTV1|nr:hypothetical protein MVLG_02797 [Microbotryum lychnidis-dioicae p1A1 Lamole]|eukprot:KDE06909.1 hypothetical protein MVLG_02797 [Microbotryum lychnidis-dioicae p1A1 Lamole]
MASSRLKRKLHNHPDAPSHYGNVDESFVEIGTALPSLSSTKTDTNEFKPLWEQEVFDDQGRKRLHGAFTGGFSAGYYNTVGSKEGWTPSTFKSSRAKRNDSQRKSSSTGSSLVDAAKHFMDDEDLEELANSRQLETSSSYAAPSPSSSTYDPLLGLFGNSNPSTSTSTSTSTSNFSSTIPTAQATLASLLEPSPSRIGLKLMRKMGWRQGQGCGPRLTKTQRKRQALELGLVLQLSFEEEEEEEGGDEERFGHYYAPLDRPLILLDAVAASQDKGRGLGYDSWSGVGGARRKEVSEQRLGAGAGAGGKRNEKGSMREEEDPYAQNEGEVVQELMDEEDDDGQMERMERQRVNAHSSDRPKGKHKDETFHDGVKVLSGFVLHHEPYKPPTTSQLPPNPPEEWRPNPTKIWAEEQAEAMRTTSAQQEGKENRAHAQLSADQRGTLLGEKLPPPPLKSVFEYLSSKDKERLSTLSTTGRLPPSNMPTSGTSSNLTPLGANRSRPSPSIPSRVPEPDEEFIIPALDSSTASLALRGFQPFSSASTSPDPIRQARYTLFLQYSAGQLPTSIQGFPFGPRPLPLSTTHNSSSNRTRMQTMKELNKELRDYVASAKVFKPVSGMLGNRFTSGTSASALLVPQVEPGLYTPVLKTKEDRELIEQEEKKKKGLGVVVELTPVEEAIKNDQFGPLTRITTTFKPDKLLCKRFGVADPFGVKKGEEEEEGGQSVGGKWKEANLEGEFKVPLARGGAGRKVEDVLGKASMDELMREANGGIIPAHTPGTTEEPGEGLVDHIALATSTRLNPKAPLPTLETVGLGDDERQGEETLTYEKAPRDIFETIFGESDDEQFEDEEEDAGFPLEGRGEVGSNAGAQPMQVEVPLEVEVPRPTLGPTMASSGPTLGETTTLLSSETVVDYKPTFVNRSSNKSAGSDKDKKKKKEKEKRKAGTLSFDMGDEEEGAGGVNVGKAVKKVKKERDTKREGKKVETQAAKKRVNAVDEADEWEEAPSIVHPSILASSSSSSSSGRKREEEKNESAIGAGAKVSFEPVKRARAADLF